MNSRREFDIAFVGLKSGIHEFRYTIKDKFFLNYQEQEFNHCVAQVTLTLEKQNGFLLLKFEIGGKLDVSCDRCGNDLPLELWDEFSLVVKLVDDPDMMNEQEEDPDVHYIGKGETHLKVADWIYEFIILSIPMQRMCKENEMGGSQCNLEVLAKLNNLSDQPENPENPIWKGLEKFKDLDN